ncbi:MAG: NAD-dependent epimerase/dehydratase family protein [Desulfobacterales bacterium]|nr:NAD-dependent epimerase/dehydratase family protein [Desulfobacterales bacterium]
MGSIGADTEWEEALEDIDAVVHLAARVHVMDDAASDTLAAYRQVNVEGTKCLAIAAANADVKRFVYISSVKVNGESTGDRGQGSGVRRSVPKQPFSEKDVPAPRDPYAVSKWEAERVLREVAVDTGLEMVILRPPLAYGPGVRANFLRLVKLVKLGIPLPFGCVKNRRSQIYIGNLVDAIFTCMTNPNTAGKTYLVSDGEDISTPDLVRRIAAASNRRALMLPVPVWMMRMAGRIIGRPDELERLFGSLTVDISKIRTELSWYPPFTMEEGIRETVLWYN